MSNSNSLQSLLYYYFYTGNLTFRTPLHIGGVDVSIETDAPLLRDAGHVPYIPGSSIVGPLKARANELFPDHGKLLNIIFGFQDGDSKYGASSRLFVEDAYPEKFWPGTTVRDSVAIDRVTETAAHGARFDIETTPCDAVYPLLLRLEIREVDRDRSDAIRFIVQKVLDDFRNGNIKLGGGKTRGLGKCNFNYESRFLDFSDADSVRTYLVKRSIDDLDASSRVAKPDHIALPLTDILDISLEMHVPSSEFQSPFLIRHGRDDGDHDGIFTRVARVDGTEIDYIPAGSIKGAFRARAEKILRTLGGSGKECPGIGVGSCADIIRDAVKAGELKSNDSLAIVEKSCPVCRLFGNGYLGGRIIFDDAFFSAAPAKKVLESVSIDRFTSGALEGKLFDAVPMISARTFFNFQIKNPTHFDKALIAFIVRDLKDGFPPLRFGYGKSKGYGLLKCKSLKIDGKDIIPAKIIDPIPKNWWNGNQEKENQDD